MAQSFIVTFAGVPGTSKTPIAHFLSITFGLPIISTDQVRFEIREDWRLDTIVGNQKALQEFEDRMAERTKNLLAVGHSFIFDGSMDRHWSERKSQFQAAGYRWFMIDMELPKSFLVELFTATGRSDFVRDHLDAYLGQHEAFMQQHAADINLRITDETFGNRLEVAAQALREFVKSN